MPPEVREAALDAYRRIKHEYPFGGPAEEFAEGIARAALTVAVQMVTDELTTTGDPGDIGIAVHIRQLLLMEEGGPGRRG